MVDHVAEALARLTSQFENSPKLRAMLSAIVGPLNTIEDDVAAVKTQRWIDTAIGAQLDGLGAIVGELRRGRDDEEYRKWLRFRIFANVSKGTPTEIIRGLRFLTQPTDSQYIEVYPATVVLFTDGVLADADLQGVVQALAPAGIGEIPVAVTFGARPFRFAKSPQLGELFVNGGADYLTAEGSDLQLSEGTVAAGAYTLGGVVPSELAVGVGELYLDIGGATLAVYDPNSATTLGHDHLTGVHQ